MSLPEEECLAKPSRRRVGGTRKGRKSTKASNSLIDTGVRKERDATEKYSQNTSPLRHSPPTSLYLMDDRFLFPYRIPFVPTLVSSSHLVAELQPRDLTYRKFWFAASKDSLGCKGRGRSASRSICYAVGEKGLDSQA